MGVVAPEVLAPTVERVTLTGGPRLLDGFGLPQHDPARGRALEARGLPDPRDDPDAWTGEEVPEENGFDDGRWDDPATKQEMTDAG
jgi:hypothetical protein